MYTSMIIDKHLQAKANQTGTELQKIFEELPDIYNASFFAADSEMNIQIKQLLSTTYRMGVTQGYVIGSKYNDADYDNIYLEMIEIVKNTLK